MVVLGVFYVYQLQEHKSIEDAVVTIIDLNVKNNGIEIKWQCDNTQVTSYRIYRQEEKVNDKWELVEIVADHPKYYVDSTVKDGRLYGYRVMAFNNNSSNENKKSKMSSPMWIYVNQTSIGDTRNEFEFDATYVNNVANLTWTPISNIPLTSWCIYHRNGNEEWEFEIALEPTECTYQGAIIYDEYKIIAENSGNKEHTQMCEAIVKVVDTNDR